jgi:hypothetical protein
VIAYSEDFVNKFFLNEFFGLFYYCVNGVTGLLRCQSIGIETFCPACFYKVIETYPADVRGSGNVEDNRDFIGVLFSDGESQAGFQAGFLTVLDPCQGGFETTGGLSEGVVEWFITIDGNANVAYAESGELSG